MSIRIKLRKNEIKSNRNYGQYFAETVSMGTVGVEQMAEEIARNCTLKPSDVQGALIALQEVMASHLQNGEKVVLPGIITFLDLTFNTLKSDTGREREQRPFLN